MNGSARRRAGLRRTAECSAYDGGTGIGEIFVPNPAFYWPERPRGCCRARRQARPGGLDHLGLRLDDGFCLAIANLPPGGTSTTVAEVDPHSSDQKGAGHECGLLGLHVLGLYKYGNSSTPRSL